MADGFLGRGRALQDSWSRRVLDPCKSLAAALHRWPILWRRTTLILWDCAAWVIALLVLLVIRYDLGLGQNQWQWSLAYAAGAMVLQIVLGLATHAYLGRSRVGSFHEATWLAGLVFLSGVPLGLLIPVITSDFPRALALVLPPVALVLMAAGRWAFRMLLDASRRNGSGAVNALVYGAGDAGHQVAALVEAATDPHYRIIGFIDDDPGKRFLRIHGHRVFGGGDQLVNSAREQGADVVILAVSNPSPEFLLRVSDECQSHGLELVVIPPVREMIGGQISLSALRPFNVADLLGRRPIETDLSAISHYITGKTVLVTGAGGSIGSELASQLFKLGPSNLILLDRDESALHSVQLSLYGVGLLDTDDMVLCDIRDREALSAVFHTHRPDVVFHAAALKHLPLLQRFPDEGWKTNVLGTLNVLSCAHEVGVRHFVNVSTDKAADASSTLGSTKRLAERMTAWFAREYGLPYLSVRFGNVLGSRGSVLHTFRAQIERGGPVTVTHPDVTRYFMTIPEACQLVLQAGAIGNPGDVLVLDMGEPVRIVDVAERLIAESDKQIEIRYTGLRPGEKLHEVLFSSHEQGTPGLHPLISQVSVPALSPAEIHKQRAGEESRLTAQTGSNAHFSSAYSHMAAVK